MNIKTILNYAIIGGLFLIPFTPLIVADSTFFPYIGGKAYYFRILVEIITALWVVLACLDAKYRPKSSPLVICITAFTFIALLADVFGVHPIKAIWSNFERMEGWMLIVHLWLYFIVMSSTFIEKRLWFWWANVTLAASLVTVFDGFRQLTGASAIHQSSDRIDASLGNSAYLAVYALLHAFIAGYLSIVMARGKNIVMTCLYVAIAIAELAIIYYTQTRGTLVGVALGGFVGLLYYGIVELLAFFRAKETPAGKKSMRNSSIALGLCLLMIIGGITFWQNKDGDFVKSNKVLSRFSSTSLLNRETQGRAYIWPMALEGFKERPVLGWGQEGFNYVFNKYYDPHMWRHEQWFDRAHNVFLDWLVAGGLFGLASYLSLYFLAVWIIVRSKRPILERALLLGMIVSYTVHNIFVFDNISSYVMFFSILAYLQFSSTSEDEAAAQPATDGTSIVGKPPILANLEVNQDVAYYAIVPLMIVILGLSLYFINIRSINSSQSLIEALKSCNRPNDGQAFVTALDVNDPTSRQEIREQLLICADNVIRSAATPTATKNAMYNLVASEASKQALEAPLDARGFIFAGTFLQGVGNFAEAEKFLGRAMELSPQKQAMRFANLLNYIQLKKNAEALKLAEETYLLDTQYDQSKIHYAVALIYNGKSAEADALLKDKPELADNQMILQAYVAMKEYSKALPLFLAKEKRQPESIGTKVSIAAIYMKQNRRADAIKVLQSIAAIDPNLKPQITSWIADINAGKNPVQD